MLLVLNITSIVYDIVGWKHQLICLFWNEFQLYQYTVQQALNIYFLIIYLEEFSISSIMIGIALLSLLLAILFI